jgi:hypothetical protein
MSSRAVEFQTITIPIDSDPGRATGNDKGTSFEFDNKTSVIRKIDGFFCGSKFRDQFDRLSFKVKNVLKTAKHSVCPGLRVEPISISLNLL